ncbi:hypothetical protein ACFYTQ_35470 [Nocardia sp. NPDC004068]|uniref:hypothetical protein n=1 Tax=Nocardia sp. NPDC004068 TaxID=3364303 RepID=UPI00369F4573
MDYAVIVFDKNKVKPVATIGATTITMIGAPPMPGTILCKQGVTSGRTCGTMVSTSGPYFITTVGVLRGDSGAPVVEGTTLIGNQWITGGGTSITAIIADLGRIGGPGAGFHLTAWGLPEHPRPNSFSIQ